MGGHGPPGRCCSGTPGLGSRRDTHHYTYWRDVREGEEPNSKGKRSLGAVQAR